MSLYQCPECGCCENTALGYYHVANLRGETPVCSFCHSGEWHGVFPRTLLPKGEFKTNDKGNLEHIETGSEDFKLFAIHESTQEAEA